MKRSLCLIFTVLLLSASVISCFAEEAEPPCSSPAGHLYTSHKEVTPPTCDCFGRAVEYDKCEHCGHKKNVMGVELAPMNHEPDGPVQVNGNLMSYTCTRCKSLITEEFIPRYTGDMDLDFRITASDARAILRTSVNLDKPDDFFAGMADVNNDSKITAEDARTVLRMSVDLEYKMSYNTGLRYMDEIFTVFLPPLWRGKYDIVKNGDTTEFRLKNGAKLFDITFVPDESYFVDGVTQVLAEVSGNKTGYLITHIETDLPCTPAEEEIYMTLREDLKNIFSFDIHANTGYTLDNVYSAS